MRNLQKRVTIISLVLFLGMFFLRIGFGENTATFSASCFVPSFATMTNDQGASIETQTPKEEVTSIAENNSPNLIQQQEEIISEDNSQAELITTVCAK